jgi:hypothetical protein
MSELYTVPRPTPYVVARDIEGESFIVPLAVGIRDVQEGLHTLSETGKAVRDSLDGRRTLGQVVKELAVQYGAPEGPLPKEVLGLADELVRRKILVVD